MFFVVSKNSILLRIIGFHMFLENKAFFRFPNRAQPGTSYFFLANKGIIIVKMLK